jgi:PglZ domain
MRIADFVRENVLRPRLEQTGCLVVYDAEMRYRQECFGLGSDKVSVVDASESSIDSRERALAALRQVGQSNTALRSVLIYIPTKKSETEEQKQSDPFAFYAACGSVFPKDDGDNYLDLCLRAKPDHSTEIRRVFAESPGGPSFAVIDAIGGGARWPQLRAALGVESGREILAALLAPNAAQLEALKNREDWIQEARDFLRATLGVAVKTRSRTLNALTDEVWRFVLFSEFAFDLPAPLPESIKDVPRAPKEARPVVEDVCDRLRSDPKARVIYIEQAGEVETELNLAELCAGMEDLGERETFPFEERTSLRTASKGITDGDSDATRLMLARHNNSVWLGKGESQAQWELVRSGLALVEACEDLERQLPEHTRSQQDLLNFYVTSLREADRLQREFEQSSGGVLDEHGLMSEVIDRARDRYRQLTQKVQGVFIKHLETGGWPPPGRVANNEAFDRLVADRLKESGRKVAYVMVDALRYELGVSLEKMLAEDGPVELQAAYVQLPSITSVGMASLLPGAHVDLKLTLERDALVPKLAADTVGNVPQRMSVLSKRYGDRFAEMLLNDFVRSKTKIAETVDLLVLRSTEIDSHLELNPETTLGLIPSMLKLIRVSLYKLRDLGFKEAIIVTDHGFFLNPEPEAGDVCIKPQGKWPINAHDRMMLGDGIADAHNLVMGAEKVGISGDFAQAAMPLSMAPYRSGHLYLHGGASLQEAVVPILVARLDTSDVAVHRKVVVELSYKAGATRITTRIPVIEVALISEDIFTQGMNLEVLLEAQDSKGKVVGEPRPGGAVDPATRTVALTPGKRIQIAMRMDEEFRGKFAIKVLNPKTLAAYKSLALETDYTE